jgi:hypothetical protein
MIEDWGEAAITVMVVIGMIAVGLMRMLHRDRVVDVRTVRKLGSYGGIDVELVSSSGARRYVALHYEVKTRNGVREIQVLLNSANTRRLAEFLEVAVAPGRTVAHARLAAHRARRRKSAA